MGINNKTKSYRITGWPRHGKREIWILTFPDRENTGKLVNLILRKILLLKW